MPEPRRRPLRLLVCLLLVALAGFGCASSKKKRGVGLTRIVESGELRVGVSGEQPPLNMTARSGELIGMEIALARVLAKSMGVEAKFVQRPFGKLLESLEKGDFDMVMSGVTITPERSTRVTFVGPYYTSGKTILTKSEELAAVEVPQDLDRADLRFAALAGSTSEQFARDSLPNAKLDATKTLEKAIEKVRDGKVDAMLADRETCSFAVLRWPDAGLVESPATYTVEPMGVALRQGEPQLANLIQTYLNALADSGALERAQRFWFKDPSWVKDLR